MKKQLQKIILDYLSRKGINMSKLVSSGGLFNPPTYDRRTIFTLDDFANLNRNGFSVDDDLGNFLINAILFN